MTTIDLKQIESAELPPELVLISDNIKSLGGTTYIVGGWVRDCLLKINSNDFDLEIHGLEFDELRSILSAHGRPNLVGKAFGVITMSIKGINYDFSFPRTESKTGVGHKGFLVKPDKNLTFEIAASRRDFTIYSMGIKLPEMTLADPFNGISDLKKGVLKHVSDAFSEDPLRALRAVHFAARFNLKVDKQTLELCSKQPLDELPNERIFAELQKLLLKSKKPSIGLEVMRISGILKFFPELKALVGVKQDPEWHPEGDVWEHNNLVVDEAAIIRDTEINSDDPNSKFEKLALMFGALCHDFGKPATTIFKDGRWRSPSHDVRGVKKTHQFLARITNDQKLIKRVTDYVREHLKPALYYNARHNIKPSTIRRLSTKINITRLLRIAKADHFGRHTPDALEKRFEAGDWLLKKSQELDVLSNTPKPLLTGKILLSLGLKPGPKLGDLIKKSFEIQLDEGWGSPEQAIDWAKKNLPQRRGGAEEK